MNKLVALPIAAAIPTIVPALPVVASVEQSPDPIFAALDAFRRVDAEFYADDSGDIPDEVGDRWTSAVQDVIDTKPTTPAGLCALTGFARDMAERSDHDATFADTQWIPVFAAIDDVTRGMAGLRPWTPPQPIDDAELIALGKQLEPLVDAYYAARRPWATALVQRESELDERFGSPADRGFQDPPEYKAIAAEIDDRVGLDQASDRLHVAYERIEAIAKAIARVRR